MSKTMVECVPVLCLVLLLVNFDHVLSDLLISEHQYHHVHCTHQHPREDQVVRGVHIEPAHIVKKRSIDQPLRISIFYDHSVYRLEPEKFDMINNTILPEAVKFWEQALKVRKTGGPIKLNSLSAAAGLCHFRYLRDNYLLAVGFSKTHLEVDCQQPPRTFHR